MINKFLNNKVSTKINIHRIAKYCFKLSNQIARMSLIWVSLWFTIWALSIATNLLILVPSNLEQIEVSQLEKLWTVGLYFAAMSAFLRIWSVSQIERYTKKWLKDDAE